MNLNFPTQMSLASCSLIEVVKTYLTEREREGGGAGGIKTDRKKETWGWGRGK